MGIRHYFRAKPSNGKAPARDPAAASQADHAAELRPPLFPASGSETASGEASSRSSAIMVDDIKHEVMVSYLYQQQSSQLWVNPNPPPGRSNENEGVLLRKSKGQYMACPASLSNSLFAEACSVLNVHVAMTVSSRVIKTFLQWSPEAVDVPLMNGLRIQIVPTIADLPRARKLQFAAFVAREAILVVWDDDPLNIVARAKSIENELMALVWKTPEVEEEELAKTELAANVVEVIDEESGKVSGYWERRPTNLLNTILVAFTLALIITTLGAGYRQIGIEVAVDGNMLRLAFVALTPIQIFFTLFFGQVIIGCTAQCIGPVSQLTYNSKYYSARPPPRLRSGPLPHITIQCPVYKEGLSGVIAPTIKSIKQAISTYELQGGTANILINDDGLQLYKDEDQHLRKERIDFYADHNIGWVARPPHGKGGFQRKGKFKKASNMNFALMISCKVEDKLALIERNESWTQAKEAQAYENCLKEVLDEDGRAWADGNIRVGDYILLVDSDTRVPPDCLLDAASEMEQSPEVGIMQYSSGVMQVVHNYFENGITFFTNLIYTAIRYTVANGDVAPFVGHNAILRWSAIQQVSYKDEDGYEKFWSESHVSEDFDMSLRLQVNGYTIRLAAYTGEGFKEGVSLTVYDELARWEKYAYGCNELLFHPLRFWPIRGPFTPLFRKFLFSNIRMTSKITIISYIGTYYAIGAAWIMTTANYFAIGWYNGYLDKYYIDSWKVWFSIVIVFNLFGNVALAVMRYRVGEKPFFSSLLENFKWVFLLGIFLGGLSLHVSQALLSHMFEINMVWGATAKEIEFSNFFIEVPKVMKRFKFSFAFSILAIVAMIVLATASFVPHSWVIKDFVAILPMATVAGSHLLLPIALNPALMTFQW
ncbi:unnamed protein product [Tuber melanosporum]|uniref:(Perigord truffle) hypothetical protein n=1 Tax=Tuber melanosporum (strain Mel28) TaxID=656061 RepID=D5G7M3_TUBMM|nr:uncharacterized protein GSTUM_00004628001 [Tuber melanosporum]CAZ80516.1 unnamed protein product [Tuber melanosporum]